MNPRWPTASRLPYQLGYPTSEEPGGVTTSPWWLPRKAEISCTTDGGPRARGPQDMLNGVLTIEMKASSMCTLSTPRLRPLRRQSVTHGAVRSAQSDSPFDSISCYYRFKEPFR